MANKLKEKDKVKIKKRNQKQKTTNGGQIMEEIQSNTHNFVNDLQNNTENIVNSLLNIFNSNDNNQKQEICKNLNMDSCPMSLSKQDAQQIVSNYKPSLPRRTTIPKPLLPPTPLPRHYTIPQTPLPRHYTIPQTPLPRHNTIPQTPLPRRKTVQSPIQPRSPIQPQSPIQSRSPIQSQYISRQEQIQQIDDIEDVFSKFNTIYNQLIGTIFEKYKDYKNGLEITDENLKGILLLMKIIPTITQDLKRLTTEDRSTFRNSYQLLLDIVTNNCLKNWATDNLCNLSSKGAKAGKIYTLLKDDAKTYLHSKKPIPDSVLLNFIQIITPKIITNFAKVTDKDVSPIILDFKTFATNNKISFQLGGKKSQSLYTNILGKLKKLYKFPKDRKKYVKHNGSFITVSEYKNYMKNKNTSKTNKKRPFKIQK